MMTPEQALAMIDGILAQLKLDRGPTLQLIEAVKTLAVAIAPTQSKPAPEPPQEPPK